MGKKRGMKEGKEERRKEEKEEGRKGREGKKEVDIYGIFIANILICKDHFLKK